MPIYLQQWMEKIDSRILRERVLIFLTLLAVIFLLWTLLLQSRFDNQRKALELESQQIESQRKELELRVAELTASMASDPAILRKAVIAELQQRIGVVETNLAGLSQGLISAALLPKALEDILQKTASIRVLQVRTLPVSELQIAAAVEPGVDKAPAGGQLVGSGVFKHGVLIRVTGSFQQLLQLVGAIETLPWRFYWESLDYRVTRYPNAEIDIRVFTLSSEEGLLGV